MLNFKRELENKSLNDVYQLSRKEWENYSSAVGKVISGQAITVG